MNCVLRSGGRTAAEAVEEVLPQLRAQTCSVCRAASHDTFSVEVGFKHAPPCATRISASLIRNDRSVVTRISIPRTSEDCAGRGPCWRRPAATCATSWPRGAELSPPQLPPKPKLPVHLNGEWLSLRCEVQPLGLFLARRLLFHPGNGSWSGWFQYYRDPNCKQRWFLLSRQGTYEFAGPSQRLRGATNVNLHTLSAQITPQHRGIVTNLNSAADEGRCGSHWSLRRTQDVTVTGGCRLLGVSVPSTAYEVVHNEVDVYGNALLFLGHADTEGEISRPDRRATAYETPLVQCRALPEPSNELAGRPLALVSGGATVKPPLLLLTIVLQMSSAAALQD
ncbi:hypothetical protein MRX96_010451 [Rhipicephalus microplus]